MKPTGSNYATQIASYSAMTPAQLQALPLSELASWLSLISVIGDPAQVAVYANMTAALDAQVTPEFNAASTFGFVGDLLTVFDGAMTNGSNVLTCATSLPFTSTAVDAGKRVTVARAGAAGAQLTTTIVSITDTGHAVLAANAGTTTAGACGVSFGTDNTAAIAAMVAKVNSLNFGCSILFPQSATNAYGFTTRVVFNKPVQLRGIGGGHTCDTGDYTRIGGTRLAWWGTSQDDGVAFGAFFEFSPTGVQSLKRTAMRHCWLDCRNGDQNQSIIGLKLASNHGVMIEDFFIMDPAGIGIWLDVDPDPTEARDTSRFSIRDFCVRALDNPVNAQTAPLITSSAVALTTAGQNLTLSAAGTMTTTGYAWVQTTIGSPCLVRYTGGGGTTTLTGLTTAAEMTINVPTTVNGSNVVQAVPGNACGIFFNGGTTANACCGEVSMGQISHGSTWGPAAVEHGNSDSIDVDQLYINGGSNVSDGAINRRRKPGVRFGGSNTSDTLASRNNAYRMGDPGLGGVSVMELLNTGAGLLSPAIANYWDLYQLGNGAPIPNVESTGVFDFTLNGGYRPGPVGPVSFPNQAIVAATLTYIQGSGIPALPQSWQVGLILVWRIGLTSGAAGIAANVINVRVGTTGTTADAVIATFTTGIGTAVAGNAELEIRLALIGPLGGAAAALCTCQVLNNGTTGFTNAAFQFLPATAVATFATSTAKQIAGITLTTGASKTATITRVARLCESGASASGA
jgi:hypothetical protein